MSISPSLHWLMMRSRSMRFSSLLRYATFSKFLSRRMAKKTVIRRLFKYLPVSIEAVRAVEIDEKSDRGEAVTQQDFIEGEFIEKGTAAEQYLEAPVVDDEIHENN